MTPKLVFRYDVLVPALLTYLQDLHVPLRNVFWHRCRVRTDVESSYWWGKFYSPKTDLQVTLRHNLSEYLWLCGANSAGSMPLLFPWIKWTITSFFGLLHLLYCWEFENAIPFHSQYAKICSYFVLERLNADWDDTSFVICRVRAFV